MGLEFSQYDIILVNLDPTIGSEIRKTRPCLIISPNELNWNLRTIIIAPITSNISHYPTRIKIVLEIKEGRIVIDQIRTIDKSRVIKKLRVLEEQEMHYVKRIIEETFVM
ncbi:MAG: type II toxin-antitoxin system PemK/MazF family toxin [Saprospiraceae bacterium]